MSEETLIFTLNEGKPNEHTFRMNFVEGGLFQMGNPNAGREYCPHKVQLSDFYLAEFPVTQALYKAVMGGANPSYFKGDDLPVEQVSWEHITNTFLPKLRDMLKEPCFALPTEAQWEYAARGGKYEKNVLKSGIEYAGSSFIDEVAWYSETSYDETMPVGFKESNALGLYDMSGNIWEWCADGYVNSYKVAHKNSYRKEGILSRNAIAFDPTGAKNGSNRVFRGGNYYNSAWNCRVRCRTSYAPTFVYPHIGFRLFLQFSRSPDGL
jgi:formylglycine-generating enzyme required for sulfatase activity